jgi:hypothetical protein
MDYFLNIEPKKNYCHNSKKCSTDFDLVSLVSQPEPDEETFFVQNLRFFFYLLKKCDLFADLEPFFLDPVPPLKPSRFYKYSLQCLDYFYIIIDGIGPCLKSIDEFLTVWDSVTMLIANIIASSICYYTGV